MRIEGETLREAWVMLTRQEALSLREVIDALLNEVAEGEDWHAHVTSQDGTVELTIGPDRGSAPVP